MSKQCNVRANCVASSLHRLDDLVRRVRQVVGGDHVEAAVVEDLLAKLDIGALEAPNKNNILLIYGF